MMNTKNADQNASFSTNPFAKKALAKKKTGKNTPHAISFHRGTFQPLLLTPGTYHRRGAPDRLIRELAGALTGEGSKHTMSA